MNAEAPPPQFQDRPRLWVEILMAAMAVATVWLSFEPDFDRHHLLSWTIWGVFVAEYGTRLATSKHRWAFVRANPADLIAILPWDIMRAFRLFRLLRVLQLIRGLVVLRRVGVHISGILSTNGLMHSLVAAAALVSAAGLLITRLEPRIRTVGDGMWWSVVTATTVGYGDLPPQTTEGRLVAVVLWFIGIGVMAMVTGSIATYFIGSHGPHNPHVRHVQRQLDEWERMSPGERRELALVLRTLAEG